MNNEYTNFFTEQNGVNNQSFKEEKVMYTALQIAAYFFKKYFTAFDTCIDEMKLHKLLYFAQKEYIIQKGDPLFLDVFKAWKFGPVLPCIRQAYKESTLREYYPDDLDDSSKAVLDDVFNHYSKTNSWALSMISHGEYSWKQARVGLAEGENGDHDMSLDDIFIDAEISRRLREGF